MYLRNNIVNSENIIGLICLLCYSFIFLCIIDIQYEKTGLLLGISSSFFFLLFICLEYKSLIRHFIFNKIDLFVLIISVYFILNSLLIGELPWLSDDIYNVITCFIVYYLFRGLFTLNYNKLIIFFFLIFIGIVQLVIGILQNYHVIQPINELFIVTGTFDNPGILGNFIACISPISLYFILNKKQHRILFIISIVFFILGSLMLIKLNGRAAWIGYIVGTFYILNYKFNIVKSIKKNRKVGFYLIPSIILLCIFSIWIYKLKPDSANGRLLIYKIIIYSGKDDILFGKGYGTFQREYNKAQGQFFSDHIRSAQQKYADYNSVGFNDFLQIFFETGIIGLMLIILLILSLIRKTYGCPQTSKIAFSSLLELSICALFSYPLQNINLQIIVAILLSMIATPGVCTLSTQKNITDQIMFPLLIICSASLIVMSIKDLFYLNRWETFIKQKFYNGDSFQIESYSKFYTELSHNKYFLYNYSMELAENEYYEDAIKILNETCKHMINPDILIVLGNAYKETNQINLAEKYYNDALNIIPHRITPIYKLFQLHKDHGNLDLAMIYAIEIVNYKSKVANSKVEMIKKEIKDYIESFNEIYYEE